MTLVRAQSRPAFGQRNSVVFLQRHQAYIRSRVSLSSLSMLLPTNPISQVLRSIWSSVFSGTFLDHLLKNLFQLSTASQAKETTEGTTEDHMGDSQEIMPGIDRGPREYSQKITQVIRRKSQEFLRDYTVIHKQSRNGPQEIPREASGELNQVWPVSATGWAFP